MAASEEILGQFLGDASFPVDVGRRRRAGLLLGLRRPAHPASGQPDVLRHRRLVAELRPHVPAVRHAVRRRLAGQERQRLRLHDRHPGRPGPSDRRDRVQRPLRRPGARATPTSRPRWARTSTPSCPSTAATSPTGGGTGFGRRWSATSPSSRPGSTPPRRWTSPTSPASSRTRSTSTIATGRSTGCSTSPSCPRRSSCGRSWRRPAATVDEALLGRLQNSASDRNWDSIEALWRMKNEVRDDDELRAAFAPEDVGEIARLLRAG